MTEGVWCSLAVCKDAVDGGVMSFSFIGVSLLAGVSGGFFLKKGGVSV